MMAIRKQNLRPGVVTLMGVILTLAGLRQNQPGLHSKSRPTWLYIVNPASEIHREWGKRKRKDDRLHQCS